MMHKYPSFVLYLCLALQLAGLVIFFHGYFPVKQVVPGFALPGDGPPEPTAENIQEILQGKVNNSSVPLAPGPVFGRVVIMLIDALRADFVFGDVGIWMPFTRQLMENGLSLNFIAKAHPPTVTMPRIKALTTGGIPGFVDVVLNFDSSELLEDNLIAQLHRSGKKIAFYGDDTWIRLFPDHFIRSDGTTSFFVTDYTEVDYNVSRHIDSELVNTDWDVMILHYLGLDHIGHLAGPSSPLVKPKLKEMDDVIKKLHTNLDKQDKERDQSSLLIVCGDHGMSDQGSHGGASLSETVTPLLMLSSAIRGKKKIDYNKIEEIYQIDVAPTLSLLLGLPIPQNSLGAATPTGLSNLPMKGKLHSMEINTYQLAKVFRQNVPNYKTDGGYMLYKRALGVHAEWLKLQDDDSKVETDPEHLADKVTSLYLKAMIGMRERLASSLSKYDVQALVTAVLLLWLVLICLLHCHINHTILTLQVNFVSICLFCVFTVSLPTAHFIACTGPNKSGMLCGLSIFQILPTLILYLLILSLLGFIVFTMSKKTICHYFEVLKASSVIELYLIIGTMGHTISLLSSSFVEEEHQTWYFFTQTIMFIIILKNSIKAFKVYRKSTRRKEPEKRSEIRAYGRERLSRHRASSSSDSGSKVSALHPATDFGKEYLDPIMLSVIGACICRILRSWNQTGDKWAQLPDVGDWLNLPEQKMLLSILVGISLAVVILTQWIMHEDRVYRIALAGAAVGVYLFRAANGAVYLLDYYETVNNGASEAQAVYGLIAIVVIYTFLHYVYTRITIENSDDGAYFKIFSSHLPRRVHAIITLVMLLLMRPHNITAFAMIVVLEYIISMHLLKRLKLSVSALTLLYIWFGQAGFYFQGNSNSLSTVDVSAGYVGLDSYNPVVIGILMAISTYASPIFWLVSLVSVLCEKYRDAENGEKGFVAATYNVCFTLGLSRALPLAVYTALTTGLRYHLFVWSVFSPKLLYEGMYTLISIVFIILL